MNTNFTYFKAKCLRQALSFYFPLGLIYSDFRPEPIQNHRKWARFTTKPIRREEFLSNCKSFPGDKSTNVNFIALQFALGLDGYTKPSKFDNLNIPNIISQPVIKRRKIWRSVIQKLYTDVKSQDTVKL